MVLEWIQLSFVERQPRSPADIWRYYARRRRVRQFERIQAYCE